MVLYKNRNVRAFQQTKSMIQNTRYNLIAYILPVGLLVCSVVFVATPVMAQGNTAGNSGLSTLEVVLGGVGIGGVIAIVHLIFKGGQAIGTIQTETRQNKEALNKHEKDGKERVKELKEIINKGFESIQGNIKDIESRITTIETRITTLETRRMRADLSLPDKNVIGHNSPLALGITGKKYFKESGSEQYLKKHFERDYKEFEGLDKVYKIENKAIDVIHEKYRSNDSDLENIREYLYDKGIQGEYSIIFLAIGLRDMVCDKKGIVIKKKEKVEQ